MQTLNGQTMVAPPAPAVISPTNTPNAVELAFSRTKKPAGKRHSMPAWVSRRSTNRIGLQRGYPNCTSIVQLTLKQAWKKCNINSVYQNSAVYVDVPPA